MPRVWACFSSQIFNLHQSKRTMNLVKKFASFRHLLSVFQRPADTNYKFIPSVRFRRSTKKNKRHNSKAAGEATRDRIWSNRRQSPQEPTHTLDTSSDSESAVSHSRSPACELKLKREPESIYILSQSSFLSQKLIIIWISSEGTWQSAFLLVLVNLWRQRREEPPTMGHKIFEREGFWLV